MFKSEDKTIDGVMYRVTQLPLKKGRPLLVRLIRSLGPSIGKALEGLPALTQNQNLGEVDLSSLLPSITGTLEQLAQDLNDEDLEYATRVLAEMTQFSEDGGQRMLPLANEIEAHFAGRYWQMFAWLGFALKVNYLDFLESGTWLNAMQGNLQKAQAAASKSRKSSTGSSTGSRARKNTARA